MTLAAGTRLGSYEVVAPIGAGGMGEVYRARDTRLGRDVAIKVLPDMFAGDGDRMARLEREAQLLAALSHPNIATIFGIEDTSGARALVMELVDGPTLAERLAQGSGLKAQEGGLPVSEVLQIARQIAEALEYAHERGIIHRDLKPANVKVTGDGQVKVLDFGLAKALEGTPAGSGISDSPTLSLAATAMGVILGTAAYMSPEQAKGKPVDKRTDIFAFGCLLFEMLTGRRTFEGDDVTETLAYVITRQPDWEALPPTVSPGLRKLLRRCLEKDRKKRLADIADARLEIEEEIAHPWSPATTDTAPAAPPAPVVVKKWSPLAIGAGVVAGALLAAGGAWAVARWTPAPQPVRFEIVPPAAQPVRGNVVDRNLAISSDGRHIVYMAGAFPQAQLMVRAIDRLAPEPLVRDVASIRTPFIAPDGRWVGFFSAGELKKVSITGGPPITLCKVPSAPPRGATWGADDTIVFATGDTATGLLSVPAGGGDPKVLTKPDPTQGESDHLFPAFLPGGRALLFTITSGGNAENAQVAVLDVTTGQRKTLVRGGSDAVYVDTGHLLYAAAGTIRAVRFDPRRFEVLGDAVPVVEAVSTGPVGAANYSVSTTGTLAYLAGSALSGTGRLLAWVDRQGKEEPVKAAPREYANPRISPDGTRVALRASDQEDDIWVWDFARETPTRLTFDPGADNVPIWTPDSKRIIYRPSSTSGANSIHWRAADGTGTAESLVTSPNNLIPWSISPDGTRLVIGEQKSALNLMIVAMNATGPRTIEPLLESKFTDALAEISPDGRWIAYQSNEAVTNQIYVRPFPNVNGGRWQISTTGGSKPAWSRNGRELFYMGSGAVMSVTVEAGPTFKAGNPVKLFDTGSRFYNPPQGRHYDVSPDGKRFLMIKNVGTDDATAPPSPPITVVLNWFEELKARTK